MILVKLSVGGAVSGQIEISVQLTLVVEINVRRLEIKEKLADTESRSKTNIDLAHQWDEEKKIRLRCE